MLAIALLLIFLEEYLPPVFQDIVYHTGLAAYLKNIALRYAAKLRDQCVVNALTGRQRHDAALGSHWHTVMTPRNIIREKMQQTARRIACKIGKIWQFVPITCAPCQCWLSLPFPLLHWQNSLRAM